jgi:hypothetical protein
MDTINSNFAQHVLDYGHAFGKIEDIISIFYLSKKGMHLNKTKAFYIYKGTKLCNQLNDKNTVI